MKTRYTHAADPRRMALRERLWRLKAISIGASTVAALGLWGLVSGAVAATNAPIPTVVPQPVVRTQDGSAYFNGQSSLGTGTRYAPVTRSRGS